MPDTPLRVTSDELRPSGDGRFDRFRLIGWWDQDRLARTRALVVGAGALGNEIVKNLALLGVGQLVVVDLDRVENSNLSRSVLYRARDNGRPKAEAAADAARDLYPGLRAHALALDVVHDAGLGLFRWADVVFGGLDNREARLALNRACYRLGRPWFDGAIERIEGVARGFVPDGPCYECTLSETDWKLLRRRRSCNLLSRGEMETGKTPTTPTIASIVAAVQCQEAVKWLHGLPCLAGRGWTFQGLATDAWTVDYQRRDDCASHDPLDEVIPLDAGAADVTARELLARARGWVGADARLEFGRDLVATLACPRCGRTEAVYTAATKVPAARAFCPDCPDTRRDVATFHQATGDEPFLDRSLADLGVPPFDIVAARGADGFVGYELSADADAVLGPLAGTADGVDWL